MSNLELRLLGKPTVCFKGLDITDHLSKKAFALMSYLAVGPKEKYRREELAGMLWGEMEEDKANYNFRRELWSLRRVLKPAHPIEIGYFKYENGFYFFERLSDYWSDVTTFVSTIDQATTPYLETDNNLPPQLRDRLIEAVNLYRDNFMEGLRLLDCPNFEEWMFFERERLRLKYVIALRVLARCAYAQCDYLKATELSQKIIQIDPTDESAYQQLMKIFYITGNRQEALRQYQILEQTLRIELGLAPLPETRALYEGIRIGSPISTNVTYLPDRQVTITGIKDTLPFVGRHKELAYLKKASEKALAGSGSIIAVKGEAGVGKSRLVKEFLSDIEPSVITVQSCCYLEEESLPYQPIIDALRSLLPYINPNYLAILDDVWLNEIIKLLPEIKNYLPQAFKSPVLFPQQERNRLLEAITQFLIHLSRRSTLALFFDDVQFADEPTLEMIHYLGRRINKQRILLIIVINQSEFDEDLDLRDSFWSLKREGYLDLIQLDNLLTYDIGLLVSKALPDRKNLDQIACWLNEESGGNPFFLIEILHSLQEDNNFNIDKIPITHNMLDFIQGRLLHLNHSYRKILDAASVIGRNFDPIILEQLYPDDNEQVLEAIAWLFNKHWFERLPGRQTGSYDFKHGLVRDVIYQSLTFEQQRYLHQQVGLVLEARSGPIGEMAGVLSYHFWEAHDWSKAQAYSLVAAKYSLNLYAFREAKSYYLRVLDTVKVGGPVLNSDEYLNVLLELGRVYQLLGEYEDAIQAYQQVLTNDMLSETNADATLSNPLYRKIALQLAMIHDQKGEYEQALYYLTGLERHFTDSGDPEEMLEWASIVWAISHVYFHQEQSNQALALCNKVLAILSRLQWNEKVGSVQASIYDTMAQCDFNLGNYDSAVSKYQQALEMAHRLNQQAIIPQLLIGLGNVDRRRGDYFQAEKYASESLELCQKIGLVSGIAMANGTLGDVAYNRGKLDDAFMHFKLTLDIYRQLGERHGIADYCISLAFVLLEQDEIEAAERLLWEAIKIGEELSADLVQIRAHYHLGKAALKSNNLTVAWNEVQKSIEKAESTGIQLMIAFGYRLRGEILVQQMDFNQAKQNILDSLNILEKLGEHFEVAWTIRSYARLLIACGEAERALAYLQQAASSFANLNAERELTKTQYEIMRLKTSG
jgi:predicted ATPase/DNA-binding SARP family transcriptional activator